MGALMRAKDWLNTPFGLPEDWPRSLRSAVSICLGTTFPIAIYWGPELALLYNDAWSPIPGEKHPWALGRPCREVWPEIWSEIGPLYERVQATGEGVWHEDQLLPMHRHGYTEECYFNFTFSPIRDEAGKPEGIFNAVVETTFRVIGERRERTLRELAERLATARTEHEVLTVAVEMFAAIAADVPFCLLYLLDGDGLCARLRGRAGLDENGPASPAKIDLSDSSCWPLARVVETRRPEKIDGLSARFGITLSGGPWPEPADTALLVPINLTGGTIAGFLVVGISPRRELDNDYRAFIERATTHLAMALVNVRAHDEERRRAEKLAEIDHAKTLFFSNVSHEFRTPLTLMLGPIEDSLAQGARLPQDERDRIALVHRNGLRLLKLVNSLLDFSRMEAGRAQASFEPTDLAVLTADLASNFRSATESAGLALMVDCPPLPQPVYVDRDMWEKIVLNLLSNAFKFTFEGEIAVELKSHGTAAELTVRDTGRGIPVDELPRMFERFHRVEGALGRSFEGSGIGLALVHELVKLHGGNIRVVSEEGRGTAFIISIPYGSAHLPPNHVRDNGRDLISASGLAQVYVDEALRWLPDASASETAIPTSEFEAHARAQGKDGYARILLADDNADMRDYISRLLCTHYEVQAVADGLAALEAIRADRPDLVLSDVMMPRLDGNGLLAELRRDPKLRDLPIILLSARANDETRVDGGSAGADDYLTKPFSAPELLARVDGQLKLAKLRREGTAELEASDRRLRELNATLEQRVAERTQERDRIWRLGKDMLGVTDMQGVWLSVNPAWTEILGWSDAEIVGKTSEWMEHPDDRDKARFDIARLAKDTTYPSLVNRFRASDGTYRWLSWTAVADGDRMYFAARDITAEKMQTEALRAAEEQLRQAQKMEAVGKLTGGIAHDFNNLLQVIGGNLQLLTKDVAGNERAEQRLQNAFSGVARGSKLAAQLLAFGRRQPLAPKVVNLGRLIRNMDDMLRRALGEGIEIDTIIAGGLWNAFVDVTQVENSLLNLAINARDAMLGHGKLTLEAGNAFLDDDYVANNHGITPGQYVMLAVTDTGCGMAPEVSEHVFEPFFTTKAEGHGTGLGLSMVYGFVKQSGGHIKIYSEVDRGTTFRVYLPRVSRQEDIVTDVEAVSAKGGTETILVAEDDPDVRGTVVEMLSDLGYTVLKAKDADSALVIIESGIPIDMLFTDVVMPGKLRSPELARAARARLPGIAILFTSGYTQNAIVHGGRLDDGVELLSKPYTREKLARKIRHVLRNQQQINGSATQAQHQAPTAQKAEANGKLDRKLRVLLVEDEELIRVATGAMLANLGHSVFETSDVAGAMAFVGTQAIDVMITDIRLPDGSGRDLAATACSRLPGLRVIFASGIDVTSAQIDVHRAANVRYLQKPYSWKGLADALDAVLQ